MKTIFFKKNYKRSWKEHSLKPNMLIRFYSYIKTSQNKGLSKVSGSFFISLFSKEKVITVVFE